VGAGAAGAGLSGDGLRPWRPELLLAGRRWWQAELRDPAAAGGAPGSSSSTSGGDGGGPSSACCSRPALILPEARGGRHGDIPCLSWSGAEKRGAYRPTVERRRGGGAGAPAGLRRQWRKSRGLVNLRSRARPPSLLLPCSDG
jgi:hypothetical protein